MSFSSDLSSGYRSNEASAVGSYSSGYGGGHKGADCCPLVVDPLTVAALLGFIGAATAALSNLIAANLAAGGGRRKKRSIGGSSLNNTGLQKGNKNSVDSLNEASC